MTSNGIHRIQIQGPVALQCHPPIICWQSSRIIFLVFLVRQTVGMIVVCHECAHHPLSAYNIGPLSHGTPQRAQVSDSKLVVDSFRTFAAGYAMRRGGVLSATCAKRLIHGMLSLSFPGGTFGVESSRLRDPPSVKYKQPPLRTSSMSTY